MAHRRATCIFQLQMVLTTQHCVATTGPHKAAFFPRECASLAHARGPSRLRSRHAARHNAAGLRAATTKCRRGHLAGPPRDASVSECHPRGRREEHDRHGPEQVCATQRGLCVQACPCCLDVFEHADSARPVPTQCQPPEHPAHCPPQYRQSARLAQHGSGQPSRVARTQMVACLTPLSGDVPRPSMHMRY